MTAWVLMVLGLVALITGAELLVRGGSRLAARLGIPPIVVGVTVVSLGTSTPELAIGVQSALQDDGTLALGNIAGTNTVNLLLILGLSALIRPLAMKTETLRFDLPVMSAAALLLLVMAWDGVLSRTEGVIMILGAALYAGWIVVWTRRESQAVKDEYEHELGVPTAAPLLNRTRTSEARPPTPSLRAAGRSGPDRRGVRRHHPRAQRTRQPSPEGLAGIRELHEIPSTPR